MGEKQVTVRFTLPESRAAALEAEAAWRGKNVSGLVSAVVASWLRNNDEEALARVAAWPKPTRFDPDDRSTWPEDGQRVPDCVAELAWYVKARGYDDTLARWVAFRRGEDKWVVSDRLRDRFLVDWEWCYLTDDVEPDRFATASVLNLIPPLMLGEARARWSKRIPDVDLLYVVAGHADGPEVDC